MAATPPVAPGSARFVFYAAGRERPRIELSPYPDRAPDLTAALGAVTGCRPDQWGHCRDSLTPSNGLTMRILLRMEALRPALVRQGVNKLTIAVEVPAAPFSEAPPFMRMRRDGRQVEYSADFALNAPLPEISVVTGYRWHDLFQVRGGLGLFLLYSAGLVAWFFGPPARPGPQAEVRFWATVAWAAGCFEVARRCGFYDLYYFAFEAPFRDTSSIAVMLMFFLIPALFGSVAGSAATSALRGPHCQVADWRRYRGLAFHFALVLGLQAPLRDLFEGHWASGLILGAIATILLLLLARGLFRPRIIPAAEPLARKASELARAGRAGFETGIGIRLNHHRTAFSDGWFSDLYRVRPSLLSEQMIDTLRRDEIDALLAHDFGHFPQPFDGRVLGVAIAAVCGSLALMLFLTHATGWMAHLVPYAFVLPILFGIWLRMQIPKSECAADQHAVQLLGGSEPLIRAVARLSSLQNGTVPEAVMQRIGSIASMNNVPPERVQAILAHLDPAPSDDRYTVDARRGPRES